MTPNVVTEIDQVSLNNKTLILFAESQENGLYSCRENLTDQ